MLNKNTAVHFYGHRPPLAGQMPMHHGGGSSVLADYRNQFPSMAGPIQSAARIYMPGTASSKALGSIMDNLVAVAMKAIKAAYPGAGQVLSYIGDVVDFVLEPIANLIEAMVLGSVKYLEEKAATAVLKDIEDNTLSYATDAAKDCLYAFYRRIGSTGNKVKDIKEGRDPILQGAIGGSLDTLGVARNANRVANRIYTKAMASGAKDWEAAAAVCYGVLVGFQIKGFSTNIDYKVKGISIVTIQGSPETAKPQWSLGNDFDSLYFSKLGTPVVHSLEWVEKQYKAKSGGVTGETPKDEDEGKGGRGQRGGSALPVLAVAAVALLSSRG